MVKEKKKFYKRWWFWLLIIIVVIGLSLGDDGEAPKEENQDKQTEKDTIDYNVTGDVTTEVKDDKVIMTISSNVPDGAIFETLIMNNDLESISEFLTIKNGTAIKEFNIPEDWEVGYLSAIATMRFNLDEHPQPLEVKEIYGEYGEKIKGELIAENNMGGNNINLEIGAIPYPSKEAVKEKQQETFSDTMNEVIDVSNGIIADIQPYVASEGWKMVKVIVTDSWYNSQEYEKERFAEQVGNTVSQIIKNTGQVESGDNVSVYFYDSYDKELASPKVLGGYKIKK